VGVVFYQKVTDNGFRSSVSETKPVDSLTNSRRGITMKVLNILWVAIILMIPGTGWAYGEGGGGSNAVACGAKFSKFTPANNSEVVPESEFSFVASAATTPNSIKVTIKDLSVPIAVTQKSDGFQVTGKLPDAIKGTFAKIRITGKGTNQCEANDGWLVKVK
jgi:hypothetical protein